MTLTTIIATVDARGVDPDVIRAHVEGALSELGLALVGCDWAPDVVAA